MFEIISYGDFKATGKQKKKKQIILCHTSRDIGEYLTSLKHRVNGNYDKIPNYVISREGTVLKLMSDIEHSNFFKTDNVNRNSIIICLENLGWLQKEPLKDHHINWIGNIYKEKVVDRKWRDYFIWQPYTQLQTDKTAELCIELSKKFKINLNCVGHNTKVKGVESFLGILTKSNFDEFSTDLSPAFDFDYFEKKLKNE